MIVVKGVFCDLDEPGLDSPFIVGDNPTGVLFGHEGQICMGGDVANLTFVSVEVGCYVSLWDSERTVAWPVFFTNGGGDKPLARSTKWAAMPALATSPCPSAVTDQHKLTGGVDIDMNGGHIKTLGCNTNNGSEATNVATVVGLI